MKYYTSGNATVDAISEMNFAGNVIPHNWYNAIKNDETGKPDAIGILILAEIVYWHRGTIEKDEKTGQVIGLKKRFKADLLQRSYDSFADQMGFTKRQVRDAFKRLEDMGFIKRHFRTIDAAGMKLSNVLFIEVISERIHNATFFSAPYDEKTSYPIQNNVTGPALNVDTYTESTTKITTEKKDSRQQQAADTTKPSKKYDDESDYMKLADFFVKQIRNNKADFKQPNMQKWADDFRKLVELDSRDKREISRIIKWAQQDSFESGVVLSPDKLRKRYDELAIKMSKAAGTATGNDPQQPQRSRKKFEAAY